MYIIIVGIIFMILWNIVLYNYFIIPLLEGDRET